MEKEKEYPLIYGACFTGANECYLMGWAAAKMIIYFLLCVSALFVMTRNYNMMSCYEVEVGGKTQCLYEDAGVRCYPFLDQACRSACLNPTITPNNTNTAGVNSGCLFNLGFVYTPNDPTGMTCLVRI